MAYGRRCAVAGPTVQRTGSRSFPIASASSVSRAVVVVRHAKRCSDTGTPRIFHWTVLGLGAPPRLPVAYMVRERDQLLAASLTIRRRPMGPNS